MAGTGLEATSGLKAKDLYPSIFSRHAGEYRRRLEDVMSRHEARGRDRVIDLVAARPGMRILDLACGPGTLTSRLARQVQPGGEVVGVDLAPGMIELATDAGIAGARFEIMDVENLEFEDRVFDAAACGHGLQFAPDVGRALSEARRVLREGAPFAASVPIGSPMLSAWSILEEVIQRWLPPAPRADDQDATRATVADAEVLRRAALQAGFAAARVELIEETVHWKSAGQLVQMCTSWWDCAARLDGVDEGRRRAFVDDAVKGLRARYPGPIETTGRNHVLFAVAP